MHAVLRCRTKPSPAQWCTHRSLAQPLGRASRVHALPWRAVSVSVVSEGAADEMAELAATLPSYAQERIRSFCIIAHVDHGKSTLADRLLEETGVIQIEEDEEGRALQTQVMDTLEIEQQRGITVKAMHASLVYTPSRDIAAGDALTDQEEDFGDDEELQQLAQELKELEAAELAAKGEHELTHSSYQTPGTAAHRQRVRWHQRQQRRDPRG